MKIIDANGNLIENPDLTKGYLKDETEKVHHEAVEAVEEQSHYETIAVYPNGGKDVEKVIDVQAVEGKEAYDEQLPIQRYILYTAAELATIEAEKNKPTEMETLQAQVTYTAMMTNTLIEKGN